MSSRLPGSHTPVWNRTVGAIARLENDPRYEEPDIVVEPGSFSGRRIISRDTPINQGVYVGASVREAIVVDDSRYGPEYEKVYSRLLTIIYKAAENGAETSVLSRVLRPTYDAVNHALPYGSVVTRLTVGMHDQKINLGAFIRECGGICRHKALLGGYLLERLQKSGELMAEDKISVDRNTIPGRGGHAWVRYTSSDGTPYIMDPALHQVGRLDLLQGVGWDYRRPEEM